MPLSSFSATGPASDGRVRLADNADLGGNLRDALLKPTRCYANEVADLNNTVRLVAAAHISGGGLIDNPPRIFPEGLGAVLRRGRWPVPPIFSLIQRLGDIDDAEMAHVFNMGLGMVLVLSPEDVRSVVQQLDDAFIVGEIVPGDGVQIV